MHSSHEQVNRFFSPSLILGYRQNCVTIHLFVFSLYMYLTHLFYKRHRWCSEIQHLCAWHTDRDISEPSGSLFKPGKTPYKFWQAWLTMYITPPHTHTKRKRTCFETGWTQPDKGVCLCFKRFAQHVTFWEIIMDVDMFFFFLKTKIASWLLNKLMTRVCVSSCLHYPPLKIKRAQAELQQERRVGLKHGCRPGSLLHLSHM